MNGRLRRLASLLVLASLCRVEAGAALNSGAKFLKIDTGARPAAMGGAYTAIADDVNALYYNPGGLPLLSKREFGATHSQWLLGSKFDFLGYAQPTSVGTFGVGLSRLTNGSIDARAADRSNSGSFQATDTAYTFGFGRSLGDAVPGGRATLGFNVKYLESRIGSDSASTFALDLGAVHRLHSRPLSLGFSVLNIGRGMKFLDQTDPLPLTLSAGASYRLIGALGIALDVRHEPHDKRLEVGVGTEYAIFPSFAVRAGYASIDQPGATATPFSGLGGGFGLKLGNYRADYTFTPFGMLGNAQRLSLGARF